MVHRLYDATLKPKPSHHFGILETGSGKRPDSKACHGESTAEKALPSTRVKGVDSLDFFLLCDKKKAKFFHASERVFFMAVKRTQEHG